MILYEVLNFEFFCSLKNQATEKKYSDRDLNNIFSNARQNIRYYQICTGHFKNPLDIISACMGSQVQVPPTCLLANMYYDNFWHASIFLLWN